MTDEQLGKEVEAILERVAQHHASGNGERVYPDAPEDAEFDRWFDKGVELLEDEKYALGIEAFTKAIECAPEHPAAYDNRARLHFDVGAYDEVIDDLLIVLRCDPSNLEGLVRLGEALVENDREEEALKVLECAIDCSEYADVDLQFLVNERAYLYKALAHYALGDLDAALDDIQRALALEPDVAGNHAIHAAILNELSRTDEAIMAFQRAVEIEPEDLDFQCALGMAYLDQKQYRESLTVFELVLKLEPSFLNAYIGRASLFSDLGDHASSLADADVVLKLDPENGYARLFRGEALIELDRLDEALAVLESAVADNDGTLRGNGLLLLAWARVKLGEFDGLAQQLEEAAEHGAEEKEVHHVHSEWLLKAGDHSAARETIELAIQIDPKESRFLETKGNILVASGDLPGAQASYQQAIKTTASRKIQGRLRSKIEGCGSE